MKRSISALLVLVVFGICLDVIVRVYLTERHLRTSEKCALRRPISAMLRDIGRHGRHISEDEAKAVSLEIWKELWGSDIEAKVQSCELDERTGLWTVGVTIVEHNKLSTTIACGCKITISDQGFLYNILYCAGV